MSKNYLPEGSGCGSCIVAVDVQSVWLCEQEGEVVRLVWRDTLGRVLKSSPAGFDVGTSLRGQGGNAAVVVDSVAFFANRADGQIYMWHGGGIPMRITPDSQSFCRFGNLVFDKNNRRLIAVREEDIGAEEVRQTLVALSIFGGQNLETLAEGAVRYASPCLNGSGTEFAWLEQSADCAESLSLFKGRVAEGKLAEWHQVAGGSAGGATQPLWSPDGVLFWISNQSGFWNLYREEEGADPVCLWDLNANFALPKRSQEASNYGFFDLGTLVCSYFQEEKWHLALLDTISLENTTIATDFVEVCHLKASARHVAFLAAGAGGRLKPYVMTRDFRIKEFY